MALAITTITNSIAGLSVSGVTIKDIDQLKEAWTSRDAPLFYPRPDGFVSNVRISRDSFGAASTAKKSVSYVLNYRYLHGKIGEGRGLFDVYSAMVTNVFAIIDAIIGNDTITGLVDIGVADIGAFGPVSDPAGNAFHGCDISLRVLEFVNN